MSWLYRLFLSLLLVALPNYAYAQQGTPISNLPQVPNVAPGDWQYVLHNGTSYKMTIQQMNAVYADLVTAQVIGGQKTFSSPPIISGFASGLCVQTGTGGVLTVIGSACGTTSGGVTAVSPTAPITASVSSGTMSIGLTTPLSQPYGGSGTSSPFCGSNGTNTTVSGSFASTCSWSTVADPSFTTITATGMATNQCVGTSPITAGKFVSFGTCANVVAYGADPSHTTDSTAAFNNAIAAGCGGGNYPTCSIYVPTGYYIIAGQLTAPGGNGLSITCPSGQLNATMDLRATTGNTISTSGTQLAVLNCNFNHTTAKVSGYDFAYTGGTFGISMVNVSDLGSGGGTPYGFIMQGSSSGFLTLENVIANTSAASNFNFIDIEGVGNIASIHNARFYGSNSGATGPTCMTIRNTDQLQLNTGICEQFTNGIQYYGNTGASGPGGGTSDASLDGFYIDQTYYDALDIIPSAGYNAARISVLNGWLSSNNGYAIGVGISSQGGVALGQVQDVEIGANTKLLSSNGLVVSNGAPLTTTSGTFTIPATGSAVSVPVTSGSNIANGYRVTVFDGSSHWMNGLVTSGGTTTTLTVSAEASSGASATMGTAATVETNTSDISMRDSFCQDNATVGVVSSAYVMRQNYTNNKCGRTYGTSNPAIGFTFNAHNAGLVVHGNDLQNNAAPLALDASNLTDPSVVVYGNTGSTINTGPFIDNTHAQTKAGVLTLSSPPVMSGASISSATIPNSSLANSTLSGVALGSNLADLTCGTGLSCTAYNGSAAQAITNSGVTSATGTANQVSVSGSTGAVVFSLPQNINSGAAPTFTGTNFSGIPLTALSTAPSTTSCSTWTPTDGSGAGLSFTVTSANYCSTGPSGGPHTVWIQADIVFPTTANSTAAAVTIPVTCLAVQTALAGSSNALAILPQVNGNAVSFPSQVFGGGGNANVTFSGKEIRFAGTCETTL